VRLTSAAGSAIAEVADDAVAVIEGGAVAREFRELEVELADGVGDDVLTAVVATLVDAGARVSAQTPKVVQALGQRALEPPEGRPAALDPDEATLRDVVAASLAAAYTQLLRHDPGLRIDDEPEDVHQARVATRRLRSDLRTFRELLDARADGLRDELRWLGGVLGAVRDADVLRMRLAEQAATALPAADAEAAASLLRRLAAEREDARAALRKALDGDRYLALLDRLVSLAAAPPVVDVATVKARKRLPAIVEGPWRHLAKAVDGLPDDPEDEALHEIRIRAKRTRYAAEAAAPVIGRRAAKFAKAVARLQTVLGDLQDAVVAEAWLRTVAAGASGSEALVAGQLVSVQRQAMAAARHDWLDPWDDLSSKKLRSWLR
jgi:CHAD domain-containing protein